MYSGDSSLSSAIDSCFGIKSDASLQVGIFFVIEGGDKLEDLSLCLLSNLPDDSFLLKTLSRKDFFWRNLIASV